ncbi:spore germination protein [Rossellomorea yichunensis]|uniref:spore germination protein n=1 Tax=Rossellomorea yichunensis TaxID=3077331 RepID=UPI0028E05573|nr:spore germination protein [Rossellomorea sp. YC4-1]MDT9027810.1 spore germination protein [Rossellomorea sp. YC4-1]
MNFIKKVSKTLDENVETVKSSLYETEDLKTRDLDFLNTSCKLVYIDSLVDKKLIERNIIEPLLDCKTETVPESVIKNAEYRRTTDLEVTVKHLLEGSCALFEEGASSVLLLPVPAGDERAIQEPENEHIIKGAHDGFTENINQNIFLIRRRIKNPSLRIKNYSLGTKTNTKISILYMDELVDRGPLEILIQRIEAIDVKELQSAGELEELIEDNSYTLFPQLLPTERPDRAASYLLEGKSLVIVDRTPHVMVTPITFFSFYQSPDDYNNRWLIGSFFRLIRIFSFLMAISLPAIYIAIVSFHSEVLPLGILYAIKLQVEYVPLPPLFEALAMQIVLELLKEAAIRLPSPIAQTIGIVGGLVIGTAVVEAGFISNTMIVVVALTAIASFVAPVNQMGTGARIIAFPIMLAASFFGFFGIVLALVVLLIHLCRLESFGKPYLEPVAPLHFKGLKDSFIKSKKRNNTLKQS